MRLDEREPEALVTAQFGPHLVSARDIAFADDDGVVFVAAEQAEQVLVTAHQIRQTERDQARPDPGGSDTAPANRFRRLPGPPRR